MAVLAAVALLGVGTQQAQQTQAEQPRTAMVNRHHHQGKAKRADQKSKKAKAEAKKTNKKDHDNPALKQYESLKTWSEKVDYLNGLEGQNDTRSLMLIEKEDPTLLAGLYVAVAKNDEAQERNLWLQMPQEQRHQVVDSVKNTVSLAFYNVQDWEDGWEARYAS